MSDESSDRITCDVQSVTNHADNGYLSRTFGRLRLERFERMNCGTT